MDQDATEQKEQLRKGVGNTNSRVEGQNRGRLGQIMGVGRNEGEEEMHGVNNMNTEANSQDSIQESWKEVGLGRVNGGRKNHAFGWGMI